MCNIIIYQICCDYKKTTLRRFRAFVVGIRKKNFLTILFTLDILVFKKTQKMFFVTYILTINWTSTERMVRNTFFVLFFS